VSSPIASFDGQSGAFDGRAGLPEAACAAIAAAILDLGNLKPGDHLLECGAGTGQIGAWLAREAVSYVGFDLSEGMLDAFRSRLPAGSTATVVLCDGDGRWPAADGSVRVVFGARSFHLMSTEHVVDETCRVAAPDGAALIVGRVQRDRDGVAARMRRTLHQIMRARGFELRPGEAHAGQLLDACVARGATRLEDRVVASWTSAESPARSLRGWREKERVAGLHPPPAEKAAILDEVEAWARETFGALEPERASEDRFILQAVSIGAPRT
jgi:SAM-dependent methyltransferase